MDYEVTSLEYADLGSINVSQKAKYLHLRTLYLREAGMKGGWGVGSPIPVLTKVCPLDNECVRQSGVHPFISTE